MKFDSETLAWINDKNWFKKMEEMYTHTIGEGLALPSIIRPIIVENSFGIKEFYGWGHEKWHHSQNLRFNPCECPRCKGIADLWLCQAVNIEEAEKEGWKRQLRIDAIDRSPYWKVRTDIQ
jgi:hypothetical protein